MRCAELAVAVVLAVCASAVHAADRIVSNPPVLKADKPARKVRLQAQPNFFSALVASSKGGQQLNLKVSYTDAKLYNPATQTYDNVHLRSYSGTDVAPDRPFVAPTIEAAPGDTVRIELDNQLPADPSCAGNGDMNIPHCFNGTNLHVHGLWVSPTGNSDNVLVSVDPGSRFGYEYSIPADHPAGTYWYHTHRHGSTALQVSSGMAGALIIHGDRAPSQTANGDLETLLYQNGNPIPEQVVLFQQIQYACLDAAGNIKVKRDAQNKVIAWVCDPGDVGVVETYKDAKGNGFGGPSWAQSGRYTSINGQVLATLNARSGWLTRWRLIHAGVRDTISMQLQRMTPEGVAALDKLAAKDGAAFKAAYCTGEPVPFFVVANDGLTAPQASQRTLVVLQPGYRNDLLVVFPEAGHYCLINASVAASSSVSGDPMGPRLLGKVTVAEGPSVTDIGAFVANQLVAAASAQMPSSIRQAVIDDLKAGLKLSHFTAHAPVADAEVANEIKQQVVLNIDITKSPNVFGVGSQDYGPRPYDPGRIDRALPLGHAQEWSLKSTIFSHPFHIHVNPFQIVAIYDPNGKDVSAPGAIDDYAPGAPDANYSGLKGAWKDTIWVKSVRQPDGTFVSYTVVFRTRYERYIGEYVLHCHILDHEDQGMMQNVAVVLHGQVATSAMADHH